MPTPPSRAVEILSNIRQKLITDLEFPPERVNLVASWSESEGKFTQAVGDQEILLRFMDGQTFHAEAASSGGRYLTRVTRPLLVACRVRCGLDQWGYATSWLAGDRSVWDLEEEVLNILQEYQPTDEDGNALTTCGLLASPFGQFMQDSGGAVLQQTSLLPPIPPNWGQAMLSFAVTYLPKLTLREGE